MCGIIGIASSRPCADGLLDGLARLEYRGYDSAGLMVREDDGDIRQLKSAGRLWALRERVHEERPTGSLGMGHTRWATHGPPTEVNAHPHKAGRVTVVHNGIIENFLELKAELESDGVELCSDTDTEVLGHLIDREITRCKGIVSDGLRAALGWARGSYAVVVWTPDDPEALWFARHESPLVVGLGEGMNVLASDPLALVPYTKKVVYVEDGIFGRVDTKTARFFREEDGGADNPVVDELTWSSAQVSKGPYKHFMLKEIHEQPEAVENTVAHLVDGDDRLAPPSGLDDLDEETARGLDRVQIVACGTSLHAAMVARYYFARLAGLPVAVDQAAEWRSVGVAGGKSTLTLAISQSGETADTLAALRLAGRADNRLAGIVNVPGSSIARLVDTVFHTLAGPEISVASTKAFTTQLAALYLLAARIGLLTGHLDHAAHDRAVDALRASVSAMRTVLLRESLCRDLAHRLVRYEHALYLGRGVLQPIALEGALKLKEISYLHAEGYSAAEMKHGPIALIDERMATVMLVPRGPDYSKALGNLQEIKAREGFVLGFVSEGDERLSYHLDGMFPVPDVDELVQPLVMVLPLQLLAYYVADYRGTDVDKPRNLAKSVTVE